MNGPDIRKNLDNKLYESAVDYPKNRKFPDDFVFDEDKSVKWNKEEVVRQNLLTIKQLDDYKKSEISGLDRFKSDITAYIVNNLGLKNITAATKIANKIYDKAWDDGHSGGLYEVFNEAIDITSFIEDILKIEI